MRFVIILLTLLLNLSFGSAQEKWLQPIAPQPNTILGQYLGLGPNIKNESEHKRFTFVQPEDQVFPHLANGGGWETILVLVNMGNTRVEFVQKYYDQSGAPLTVTFKSIPEGKLMTACATAGALGPNTSLNLLLFDSGTPLRIGWSTVSYDPTNARIGGYAIFRRLGTQTDFEALVPLSAYTDRSFFFPFDNLEGFVTSMALVNPASNLPSNVFFTFRNSSGEILGRGSMTLRPGEQVALSVPERFPVTRGQVGTMYVQGDTNRLSALGFRFNPKGAFATIPILNWAGMF